MRMKKMFMSETGSSDSAQQTFPFPTFLRLWYSRGLQKTILESTAAANSLLCPNLSPLNNLFATQHSMYVLCDIVIEIMSL
jgi:hypothetical protein